LVTYPDSVLLAYCHAPSTGWTTVDDLDRLSDLRVESGNLLWAEADVKDLQPSDMALLAEEFNLHRLAVEDATHTKQRPKLDSYEAHFFVVFHQLDEVDGQLEASQVACFIGERFVLMIHDGASRTLAEAKSRWSHSHDELGQGPAYLLYTLLDVVVDDYEAIADALEHDTEELEEIALQAPHAPLQRQLYSLKQRVARLRRYAFPVGRILDWIDMPTHVDFPEKSRPLFRDVHDHVSRTTDQVHNIDALLNAVIELQRAEVGTSLSETNKRLTAWAAIIAVPTFIASVYGMNFALVPRTDSRLGFWFALVLMAACAIGLYAFFKRREWL
jgi:magnesium transporter